MDMAPYKSIIIIIIIIILFFFVGQHRLESPLLALFCGSLLRENKDQGNHTNNN